MFEKNKADQEFYVFAFDPTNNEPVEGDAANITAQIRLDDGTLTPLYHGTGTGTDSDNPVELGNGFYYFTPTQENTNADRILIIPESSTQDVQVIAIPSVIYPMPSGLAELIAAYTEARAEKLDFLDLAISEIADDILELSQEIDQLTSDVYVAAIEVTVDAANSQDEYTIRWFKNNVRITSGITSPTLTVVKREDGENLISSAELTQIGTTGAYKYDEDTNRLTAGEAAEAVVSATIDGSVRTFSWPIGRDSAAP